MDAADVFRQGLGSVIPRQQQPRKPPSNREEQSESDGSSHRIAHTLTACTRCRQVSACLPLSPASAIGAKSCQYVPTLTCSVLAAQDEMRPNFTPLFAV
jgi:hypothetical protein